MGDPEKVPIATFADRQSRIEKFTVEVLGVPNPHSTSFYHEGLCVIAHPDEFITSKGDEGYLASLACHNCIVQNDCLAHALVSSANKVDTGLVEFSDETGQLSTIPDSFIKVDDDNIWGGLTRFNRYTIRKMIYDPEISDSDALNKTYTMRQKRFARALKRKRSENGLAGNMERTDFDLGDETQAS